MHTRRNPFLFLMAIAVTASVAVANDEQTRFFENNVRPLLAEHCVECHGESEQSGELRLDSRSALLKGGDSGPAIISGDPRGSRLILAVQREGDLEMPPDDPLTEQQIATLTRWVQLGAFWPESDSPIAPLRDELAKDHWAFQPVDIPEPPPVAHSDWLLNPVDAFILARLEAADLVPSPEADRRTLARRVSYSVTGLAPSPSEVTEFVNDPAPNAYERYVDRLLDSRQYGEQWARHWLDVARYSDTKGYVYAREERFWVHAWTYRDWVVQALNDDLPYDRFLLLQLAADQVADRRPNDLAAMGFLTIGRRFLGVERDIIDDRIDVVCRGTMALTVGCARCHDHKYDPIPTADYYSLYGLFDSCREQYVRLDAADAADEAFNTELATRQETLRLETEKARLESAGRVRARIADYLQAQLELHKYPEQGFDQILEKTDLLPAFVHRWRAYLREAQRRDDPVFIPWHAYAGLAPENFGSESSALTERLHEQHESVNALVLEIFATPPASFAEVVERYGTLLTSIEARWQAQTQSAAEVQAEPPTRFSDPVTEQLRRVLYGPGAPCEVPDEPIVHTDLHYDSGTCTNLWKLQGEVDRWIINSEARAPHALTLVDRSMPRQARIFRRGNPATKGDEVPRRFLSLLAGEDADPFQIGSGRLELARAIIDPANPLTARVIVNRVWAHHFGVGLVNTPSDFGTRAETPSHPQLLDWLATRFVADGWSLKSLHRQILLSATFQQASTGPTNPEFQTRAIQIDPDNRLLWRMSSRRLSFEEFRDSLLAASGELDLQPGGKPADLFADPAPVRRTLYGLVDRQFLPGTLRMFDFANPDLHIPQRPETIVPQQALFVMNHPLVLDRARELARMIADDASPHDSVRMLYQRCYQRDPTDGQIAAAIQFVQSSEAIDVTPESLTKDDWQYGYGTIDEEAARVPNFTPLPHFTGDAWQGGPEWPDATLGWVQLTATGGHPGNDRQHAAVRRWTAPRSMTISLNSQLIHEAAPGDGIRAFIVSSRAGILAAETAHVQSPEMNVATLESRSRRDDRFRD